MSVSLKTAPTDHSGHASPFKMEIVMRYFLTLPFVAMAAAAVPTMAQDTATSPDPATTQAPPVQQPMPGPDAPTSDASPSASTTSATTAAPAPVATASAGLTAEQQAAYDAWPAATKSYFDALTPARQQLFLRITDNDKAKLVALPAAQQETVWTSLEKQAAAQKTEPPKDN